MYDEPCLLKMKILLKLCISYENILLKCCISYESILLKLYVSYEKYLNFANYHLECTYYMHTFLSDGLKRNETKAEKVGSKFGQLCAPYQCDP